MGARDEAVAAPMKVRGESPEVAYRRAELERLLAALQSNDPLVQSGGSP
jgi:hypothetical protein